MTDVEPSLEDLFVEHAARLTASLAVAFGRPELAADAVQDAFVQAARHWRRIRTYEAPGAWIRRVALNRMLSYLRRKPEFALGDIDVSALAPTKAADHAVAARVDVGRALEMMPPQRRAVVVLYYLEDLSVGNIAAALQLSAGTVKAHLHAGRAQLSCILGE